MSDLLRHFVEVRQQMTDARAEDGVISGWLLMGNHNLPLAKELLDGELLQQIATREDGNSAILELY